MKKYAVILTSRFAELTLSYQVINQVTDSNNTLVGWMMLEDYFTPAQEAEVLGLQGFVFADAEEVNSWRAQFDTSEPFI